MVWYLVKHKDDITITLYTRTHIHVQIICESFCIAVLKDEK